MVKLSEKSVCSASVLKGWAREFQLAFGLVSLCFITPAVAGDLKLELPVKCEVGVDCFFQNFADLDPGDATRDPWCGEAAYDGHKGTDIRLFSLKDIGKNVPVLASAPGTVKAVRDGVADKLVKTQEDREALKGTECGNGVVIDHGNGYETQYCHMKNGSVSVKSGQSVKVGERLGSVGNSGLAQFPHVHLTMRKNRQWIDVVSGQSPSSDCKPFTKENSRFSAIAFKALPENPRQLLASGISGIVPKHENLVVEGAPVQAVSGDPVTVGWAWFINLEKGDVVTIELSGPDGFHVKNSLDPVDRHKATFSSFSGRKRSPKPGNYTLYVSVSNQEKIVLTDRKELNVE